MVWVVQHVLETTELSLQPCSLPPLHQNSLTWNPDWRETLNPWLHFDGANQDPWKIYWISAKQKIILGTEERELPGEKHIWLQGNIEVIIPNPTSTSETAYPSTTQQLGWVIIRKLNLGVSEKLGIHTNLLSRLQCGRREGRACHWVSCKEPDI